MTSFDPRRYLAVETAISVVINTLLTTVPSHLSAKTLDALATHGVRDVAVSLTPQLLMCAFMSALVPSLLTRWRQGTGRLDPAHDGMRPSLIKTAVVALALASSFTVVMLASIHVVLSPLVDNSMGPEAVLILRGAQGALAAAMVTPLALVILFGVSWTWTNSRSS